MASPPLPVGYRFSPTDEELVMDYLFNKIAGLPLPSDAVVEKDIYQTEREDLLDGDAVEGYFFAKRFRRYTNGTRPSRNLGKGTWRLFGKPEKIYSGERIVGVKRSLSLGIGEKKNSGMVMHEYQLTNESDTNQFQEIVLCRIKKNESASDRASFSSRTETPKRKRQMDVAPSTPASSFPEHWYSNTVDPQPEPTNTRSNEPIMNQYRYCINVDPLQMMPPAHCQGSSTDQHMFNAAGHNVDANTLTVGCEEKHLEWDEWMTPALDYNLEEPGGGPVDKITIPEDEAIREQMNYTEDFFGFKIDIDTNFDLDSLLNVDDQQAPVPEGADHQGGPDEAAPRPSPTTMPLNNTKEAEDHVLMTSHLNRLGLN